MSVNPRNVERAIASARAELKAFADDGPSERELVGQRNSLSGMSRVGLGTNGGIAKQLERLVYHALGDDHVDTYREQLLAVSSDDVRAAIAMHFSHRDNIVVAAGSVPSATPQLSY
jgi:zinc protease